MQYGCRIFPRVLPDSPIKSALCQYTRIMAISCRTNFALVAANFSLYVITIIANYLLLNGICMSKFKVQ